MSVRPGLRAARRSAWTRLGWRHPYLFLLGPPVLVLAGLGLVYGVLAWVWAAVPHRWLAAGCAAVAVALAVWVAFRRPGSGRAVVWCLAGVGLLTVAAFYAAGR